MDKLLVRKDVYEELLEKGFGKKDYSKLTKKVITDKNGHRRTVFVRNGEQPAETKQPKAQEGLTPEKKAKYEEMLEKVKAGSDENALFVRGEMLNKKDAIDYLEKKLGRKNGVIAEQKMKMEDEKKDAAMKDQRAKSSEEMLDEKAKENFKKDAMKMSDKGLEQKIKNLTTPGSFDYQVYSNPEQIAKVFEEELNRRKTEKNSSDETGYEKTSIFELQDKFNSNDGKELSGALKDEHEKVKKELEKRTAGDKPTSKGYKKGDTVFDRYGETSEVLATSDNYVYVKNSRGRKEWKSENSFAGKRPTQDDMKENYLDAKNEGGRDIAENNKIQKLSDKIEFSPDEMKMIRETAKEIGYKVGKDEGKLLNAINSKDKAMYSALTKKNQKAWDESGKTQKTFSSTDLLREKIQSMNGNFGSDDSEKPKKDTFKSKTEKYKKMGLDDRASAAIVAIAEIEDEIRKTPDSDVKKLDELDALRTDVQLNGLKSKYVKQRMEEDYNNSDEGKEKAKRKEDFESKMAKFKKWGLDTRASAASVAIDEIEDQIRNTPDNDKKKLEELAALRTDVQLNGLNSKYIREILG